MANQLAMDKVQAIKSLRAAGMTERRIARTLAISRKAVRRHLGRDPSKDTKAPTGKAPTGSDDPKDTKAPTGSDDVNSHLERAPAEASRSLCRGYREAIVAKLEQGLTAQRIYQDLRDEQGASMVLAAISALMRSASSETPGRFPLPSTWPLAERPVLNCRLGGATLISEMRKPLGLPAEELLQKEKQSRGDRTPIELLSPASGAGNPPFGGDRSITASLIRIDACDHLIRVSTSLDVSKIS